MPVSVGKKPRNNSGPKPKAKLKGKRLTQKDVDEADKFNREALKRSKNRVQAPKIKNKRKTPKKKGRMA